MKALDLFAGIGGASLGLEQAGFTIAAHCERDHFCCRVLKKHWPNVPNFPRIETLIRDMDHDGFDYTTIDLVWGSPPCQPFSQAGRRTGTADDRHLWPAMRAACQIIRPTWIGIENVAGLDGLALDGMLRDLESDGYETQVFEIPAAAVNAPHQRARLFLLAYAGRGRGEPLAQTHCAVEKEKPAAGVFESQCNGHEPVADRHGDQPERDGELARLASTASPAQGQRDQWQRGGRAAGDHGAGDLIRLAEPRRLGQLAGSDPWADFALAYSHLDHQWRRIPPQPELCGVDDGLSSGLDGSRLTFPALPKGHPQLTNGTRRLKALGNAVVPQIVEVIGRAILSTPP